MPEEFAANHILHDHVEVGLVLKCVVHSHYEGMGDHRQQGFFIVDVLDLPHLHHFGLFEDFESVVVVRLLIAG